jgi:hypothetical protein
LLRKKKEMLLQKKEREQTPDPIVQEQFPLFTSLRLCLQSNQGMVQKKVTAKG